MKKPLLVFALLVSLSFSSLIWQTGTGGAVVTKPVVFGGNIAVGSLDGNVYSLNPATGSQVWKTAVGSGLLDFTLFDGGLVAPTTEGRIVKIKTDGSKQWEASLSSYNASYVYGVDSNSKNVYVSADNGIYAVSKGGAVSRIYAITEGVTLTRPYSGEGYVVFGYGNTILKIDEAGKKLWEKKLEDGNFWLSAPMVGDTSIFIGALDNRLHVYHLTGGYERWSRLTDGWVLSTPIFDGTSVYFGSDDSYVYSVYSESGGLNWKTRLPLAAISEPEKGSMGGVEAVYFGCTDANIYALSADSGSIIWKGSAADRVGSPLYYNKRVIFGSADGFVYSYSTERACSIESPSEGEYVGKKEVVIDGQSVSETGSQTVQVDINGFGWQDAETGAGGAWQLIIDPSQELVEGLNVISCRVVDAAGEEAGTSFTTVSIIRDSNIPLDEFVVRKSTDSPVEGSELVIYVNSRSDGSPVDRFTLEIDGKTYGGDKNATVTLTESGSYRMTVSKIGYEEYKTTLNVQPAGVQTWQIALGGLAILLLLWVIYTRFVKKRA